MGAIQDALANEPDSRKRARLKARALAQLSGETFTRGAFTLTITSIGLTGDGDLEVYVAVTRNGTPLPIDGHLVFVNPYVLMPDGTTRTVTLPGVGKIDVPNVTEQPRAALRQMIVDAILVQRP